MTNTTHQKFIVEVKGIFGRWTTVHNPIRNADVEFATEAGAQKFIEGMVRMTGKTFRIVSI